MVGQVHQHMFCARLDLAVDDNDGGRHLLVSEVGHDWSFCRHVVHLICVCICAQQCTSNRTRDSCCLFIVVRLLQVDLVAMPEGPENPHGNGFWAKETPLLTESKAMRVADPAAARAWKISNPASTHPVTGVKGLSCATFLDQASRRSCHKCRRVLTSPKAAMGSADHAISR